MKNKYHVLFSSLLICSIVIVSFSGCASSTTTTDQVAAAATPAQSSSATLTATQTSAATANQTIIPAQSVTLNISAAATLTKVLNEINKLYTQSKPWVTITPNYASIGTLQTQIENGALCDVFISADALHMDTLKNENLLLESTRINLLTNTIVLIAPKGNPLGITGFNDLTLSKVKIIAIGDPKSTALGALAHQTFTELGILPAIQSKFVLASVVTQLMQYVDSGNVDAAVVFSTDALSDSNVTVVATGPADVNAGIVYPAAIIKASKNASAAQDYLTFLTSAQARAIFMKYGFIMAK